MRTFGSADCGQERVRAQLEASAERVASRPEDCARSPGRDFTRSRKLPLARLLLLLVTWARDTVGVELLRFFGWDPGAISVSGLVQQWRKLNDAAMPALLREFGSRFRRRPWRGRWWLVAVDGTLVDLPRDPSDEAAWSPQPRGEGGGFNRMLAVALFDVVRRTFEDCVFQPYHGMDERSALRGLVGRLAAPRGLRPLLLADRGFASYAVAADLLSAGVSFVMRAKDAWAASLLGWDAERVSACGRLDRAVRVGLTGSRGDAARDPRLRHVKGAPRAASWVRLRLVRVEVAPGRWENLVTDLERPTPRDLADAYRARWDEEVAFRDLKHTVGMDRAHTRDRGRAEQEVWGRMVLFNACSLVESSLPGPRAARSRERRADRTLAFKLTMEALRGAEVDVAACCAGRDQADSRDGPRGRGKTVKRRPCTRYRH